MSEAKMVSQTMMLFESFELAVGKDLPKPQR